MQIPQCDPVTNYLAHQGEIDAAIARVLASGRYILGPEVEAFEREFANYLGVTQVVGVANGTDALTLALKACGIRPGDRVATVSHTAVATVAAIEAAGAIPILIDIDPGTFTMDPAALETVRAAAVVPVHLYGQPADMSHIMNIARRLGMKVIEDCAQSHGHATGRCGDAAAYSFYPTKNLSAIGDGGAVATNDSEVAARLRSLREYGWRNRYISETAGINSRLDELQAAILRVKLRYLDESNDRRRAIAAEYDRALAAKDLILPKPTAAHVYHQYVVRSHKRDALRERLRARGIGTLIHYPVPVHLQPAYRGRIEHGTLTETENIVREIVSLPMYAELPDDAIAAIAAAIER
jgi:dTDP-4-amino-4,6-dideoxygalactose transaminase